MIDEQYISKTLGLLYLCSTLLSQKSNFNEAAKNEFIKDYNVSVDFLCQLVKILPVYHEITAIGQLFAQTGKTRPFKNEDEHDRIITLAECTDQCNEGVRNNSLTDILLQNR